MKFDRMGVMMLVSHLVITLVILAIYGFTLYTGHADETLKTILTVIIGYWFGSIGANAIRPSTQIQANEVKVLDEKSKEEMTK